MVEIFKVGRKIRVTVGGLFSWGAVFGWFWRPLVLFEGIDLGCGDVFGAYEGFSLTGEKWVMGARGVVGVEVAGPGHAASLVLGASFEKGRFRVGIGLAWRSLLLGKWVTVLAPSGASRVSRNL